MTTFEIIEKKANNKPLTKEEICFMVEGFICDEVKDYQMSSFMMAIYCHGLNEDELVYLTQSMIDSGTSCDLSSISNICVDKHSTGGVGDKTSLTLGPIIAANGLVFAKMSGRGLGHTGGTLDKLESIAGFQVELKEEDFINQLKEINIAIIGQSETMVKADKKMYALRDVSATIASIPLIASSIMSKKIASGAKYILLDVKYGDGAFMKTAQEATLLAKTMISIGTRFNRVVSAEISSMQQPLGNMIGNLLEVKEAMETLQGKGPKDFEQLCIQSATKLIRMANPSISKEEAISKVQACINNGKAYDCFEKLVVAQHGNMQQLKQDIKELQQVLQTPIRAIQSGYINHIECKQLGLLACHMKAGRLVKEDIIDVQVGIEMKHKLGDYVEVGDVLCILYKNEINESFITQANQCFIIEKDKKEVQPLIYKTIDACEYR